MSWHTSSRLNNRERASFSQAQVMYNDVMEEFRNNGIDSAYEPEEGVLHSDGLSGLGPQRRYLTQKSCPETLKGIYPSAGHTSPSSSDSGYFQTESPENFHTKYVVEHAVTTPTEWTSPYEQRTLIREETPVTDDMSAMSVLEFLSEEQIELLSTIPSKAMYFLINHLRKFCPTTSYVKDKICRFCKNNGERETVYRSHKLRTAGKLTCPVLRHLVCERCGATGDEAHTIKYCTAIGPEERKHYELLMQNRRFTTVTRPCIRPPQAITTLPKEGVPQYLCSQIPPQWMELEKKLMMQN